MRNYLLLLLLALTFVIPAQAADEPLPFFGDLNARNIRMQVERPSLRMRAATFDSDSLRQLSILEIAESVQLLLNLFEDTAPLVNVDISLKDNGAIVLTGTIDGIDESIVYLYFKDGMLSGQITNPMTNETFIIEPISIDAVRIYEYDTNKVLTCASEHLVMPAAALEAQPRIVPRETSQFVDLLIYYTPAARDTMGGISQVEAEIEASVTYANQALTNSGIGDDVQYRIVSLRLASGYTEAADLTTEQGTTPGIVFDIERLQGKNDGYIDDVHDVRNERGADIVLLITYRPATGVGGIAYTLSSKSNGADAFAFGAVELTAANANLSLAHEIGHIMGCNHGVTNNGVDDDGLHNYSIGYHFTGLDSNGYRTVMAYSRTGETRVPYFSNPNVNYQGVPTGGVPDGLAVTANNASTLQETAPFVGDYRDEVPPNEAPVANNETYTVKHGRTLTVDDKSGVLANDTDPNDDDLTAVLDTDVSSGTLSLNADGSFTYTPAEVYVSEVTFTYYATDGELNSFTATVTINIAENIKVLAYKIKRSNKLSGDGNTLKLSTELILLTELKEDDSQEVLGGVAAWKDGKDRFYHVYNAEDLEVNIGNLAADQSLQAMGVGEPGGGDLSIWLAAGKAKNTAISEVDDAIVPASLKGKEILASPNNLLAGEGKISVRFDKKITLNANNGTGGINDVIDDIVAAYEKKKHTESATDPFALPE